MSKRVIITADSTCDLTDDIKKRHNIHTVPLHINFDDAGYFDNVDITPDDIFNRFATTGQLPKTSAVSIGEYKDFFKKFTKQGYDIVHINIGSGLSSCHQNAKIVSNDSENIFPVDSCNLSVGTGMLVYEAALMAEAGLSAPEIVSKLKQLVDKSHASFILDKLDFLAAGGRCSSVVALGANLLNLKPCIEVLHEKAGIMEVGKKFRGKYDKTVLSYIDYKLAQYDNIKKDRIFFAHAGLSNQLIKNITEYIKGKHMFDEVIVTTACCTISSHCGPNTMGIFFMTE